jgi:hypothetical protein
MFCPNCGTNNLLDQKYCRQCGHQLTGHRIALEGTFDESINRLKKGEDLIGSGLIVMGICIINIIINWFLGADRLGILINVIIGLFIALPLMFMGLTRVDRARKLLDPAEQVKRQTLGPAGQTSIQPAPAAITDRSIAAPPPSVTEETTLNLNPARQTPRSPSETA